MSEFKLESNVPLPVTLACPVIESAEQFDPPSRWVPFKPHQQKCHNNEHMPMIGRCTRCGDVFPCPSGNCGHFDCADPSVSSLSCPGNGTETPEWRHPAE